MFFDPSSSTSLGDEDEVAKTTPAKPVAQTLSRVEQRRIRLEQLRRSRANSVTSVGSAVPDTLEEETPHKTDSADEHGGGVMLSLIHI